MDRKIDRCNQASHSRPLHSATRLSKEDSRSEATGVCSPREVLSWYGQEIPQRASSSSCTCIISTATTLLARRRRTPTQEGTYEIHEPVPAAFLRCTAVPVGSGRVTKEARYMDIASESTLLDTKAPANPLGTSFEPPDTTRRRCCSSHTHPHTCAHGCRTSRGYSLFSSH